MSWTENQGGWPPNVETQTWSGLDAVNFAWKLIKADFFPLVGTLFLVQVVALLPMMAFLGPQIAHTTAIALAHRIPDQLDPFVLEMQGGAVVVSWLSFGFFYPGMYRYALAAARGAPRSFGDAFSGARWFGTSVKFMILAGLVSLPATIIPMGLRAAGTSPVVHLPITLLLYVPVLIVTLGWSMVFPLIVDRDLGVVAAMQESWRITTGRRLDIFVTFLLFMLVIMGGCCLCGLGAPIGMALMPIAIAFIYLRLTGQPVASTES